MTNYAAELAETLNRFTKPPFGFLSTGDRLYTDLSDMLARWQAEPEPSGPSPVLDCLARLREALHQRHARIAGEDNVNGLTSERGRIKLLMIKEFIYLLNKENAIAQGGTNPADETENAPADETLGIEESLAGWHVTLISTPATPIADGPIVLPDPRKTVEQLDVLIGAATDEGVMLGALTLKAEILGLI